MDITMPGVNGIDATRAIIGKRPAIGILMLSMHSSAIIVRRAIDAGARGYLVKQTDGREVVKAVRTVASDPMIAPNVYFALAPEQGQMLVQLRPQRLVLVAVGDENACHLLSRRLD